MESSQSLVELHHGRTFTFSLPDISSKDELIKMEATAPKQKEALKPLARPIKKAEEI